ncbi:MAG: site-2 protease family protein [Actinomycetota bacterium]|nr:site-2 protease family protein [Actinomycetota bacterium]
MSWFLAFAGFAALIILHELGHFAAAKAVGMRVERFSLFFGRTPLRFQRGETEYGIGWLPLGGFVKITGMNPHEEMPPEARPRAYFRQPVWKRIVVIAAGPAVNLVLAFAILWVLLWANGVLEATKRVDRPERGSPAAGVLQPGDELVAVDGRRGAQETLARRIASHRCAGRQVNRCRAAEPVTVVVRRAGEERSFTLYPVYDAKARRPRLGFSFHTIERPIGPVDAAGRSLDTMWFFTAGTVQTIARIFEADKRKEISGVVGTYEVTRQSIELSTTRALFLLAVVSLSLGIINLFPFLPLDGGHIFWAVAEKVRGRAIPFSVMERAGFVGFALVIALFFIGFTNDIGRLTGEGFQVR